MRLLILSDIHANLEALEAVLAFVSGKYDRCICLGDVVGYGADPNETARWARDNCQLVVRGNHDRACATRDGIDTFTLLASAAATWTHAVLQPEVRDWLAQLPKGPIDYEGLQLAHGSPLDEDEYVISTGQAAMSLVHTSQPLTFIGHTHLQGGYLIETAALRVSEIEVFPHSASGNPATESDSAALEIFDGARFLLNPGSVGQPRDGDWRAACAIWDSEQRHVTFFRVTYDVQRTQEKIIAAGLPDRLALRLAYGQ